MKYTVAITEAAKRDLAEAFDYMDLTLKNPSAADDFLTLSAERFSSLVDFPKRCALVHDKMLSELGIRFLMIQSHIAFFSVDDANATVHILRVLYGRRDWAALLRNEFFHN